MGRPAELIAAEIAAGLAALAPIGGGGAGQPACRAGGPPTSMPGVKERIGGPGLDPGHGALHGQL
jgi:hypothetical protein